MPIKHSPHGRQSNDRVARRGFTLVEMLIAVALVLLMMLLFAEIFGLASESITLQRALADNDQQVRSFSTIIREDLKKRTFRSITPFDPTEDEEFQTTSFADRDGYFYISLNDPDNATDNILQFTVQSSIKIQSGDESEFYGRATGLLQNDPAVAPNNASRHIFQNTRQPEHDDGETQINTTGTSSAAEITYFVRGSRLYRRVSLLRDPVSGQAGVQPRMSWDTVNGQRLTTPNEYLRQNPGPTAPVVQTETNTGPNLGAYRKFDAAQGGASLSDNYWEDFDFSAVQAFTAGGVRDGAELIGASALQNSSAPPAVTRRQLGDPRYRFGFDQFTGISREFSHANPATGGFFFLGRFTLEEMSHGDFNFPQNPSAIGLSPLNYLAVTALTDAGVEPDGVVDEFAGGSRRGEDLLLTNVHAFDVEIWDDRIGDFLPVGHNHTTAAGIPGDYHFLRRQQTTTGITIVPGNSADWLASVPSWANRTYDTWHPAYDPDGDSEDLDQSGALDPGEDTNGNGVLDVNYDPAPYRPMTIYPPGATLGPVTPLGNWSPDTQYNVGDIVFPSNYRPLDHSFYYRCIRAGLSRPGSEDIDGDGILDFEFDENGNMSVDFSEETMIVNGTYDTEDSNGNGVLDDGEPAWIADAGQVIESRSEDTDRDGALSGNTIAGDGIFTEDLNDNGILDVEPQWIAVSNMRPLRAVRIRVRFLHQASGEMRLLSLVFSLTDN